MIHRSFRLTSATFGVEEINGERNTVLLPAESVFRLMETKPNAPEMVDVLWEGRCISVFAIDVRNRAEAIAGQRNRR